MCSASAGPGLPVLDDAQKGGGSCGTGEVPERGTARSARVDRLMGGDLTTAQDLPSGAFEVLLNTGVGTVMFHVRATWLDGP